MTNYEKDIIQKLKKFLISIIERFGFFLINRIKLI